MVETVENILIAGLVIAIGLLALGLLFPNNSITGFITASPTGTADVNVRIISAASILITSGADINLGTLYVGDSNTTAGQTGIIVENNGSIDVNVAAQSDGFFTGTSMPTDFNKLGCKASDSEAGSTSWLAASYYNCYSGANPKIIGSLEYANASDTARIDLNIFVPLDEAAGLKQGILTLTATAS